MSGLLGSMAGSWQIRQAGIDTVLEDVLRRPAIDPPPPPIEELDSMTGLRQLGKLLSRI